MTTYRTRSFTPTGLAAAGGGMIAWSAGIVLIKLTTSPFMVVSFYRHVFALPLLVVAWVLSKDRSLPIRTAGFGGILFAIHQVLHFGALRYSTVAVVTILFALQPLVVGVASGRVTGEGTTPRFFAWALVAIAGVTILILASGSAPEATSLGTLLAAGNLLLFSSYFLATKRARERVGATSWLVVMTTVSGLVVGGLSLLFRQPLGSPEGSEWIVLAAIGILPGTIGHFLVTWAHPRIHAAASSTVILGVPVLASIGAAIFVDEPFGPMHVIGAAVALAGAAGAMKHLPPPGEPVPGPVDGTVPG